MYKSLNCLQTHPIALYCVYWLIYLNQHQPSNECIYFLFITYMMMSKIPELHKCDVLANENVHSSIIHHTFSYYLSVQ